MQRANLGDGRNRARVKEENGAAFTLDSTSLAFGDVVAIERDCPTPQGMMEQEQRYLGALKDVTNFYYGILLWLWTEDGRALAFTAQGAK